jgi:hypothetical protein
LCGVGPDDPVSVGGFEDRAEVVETVLMVPGAKPDASIRLTQASTCERRIDFSGRSAKLVEPTARFIASTVPDTHTCRDDRSTPGR